MSASRRAFLGIAGMASLVLAGARGVAADPPVCYDPANLPLSQRSRRRSLGYVDASTDPKRHCSLCSFFSGAEPGCGTCTMLGGATVRMGAVCNSFAAKGGS